MHTEQTAESGFTLVELMVVVLIIGILVAIAIPVFSAAAHRTSQRTCFMNQRLLEGAVQQYLNARNENKIEDITGVNGGLIDSTASPLIPEYIKDPPECPNNRMLYTIDASGTTDCPDTVTYHGRFRG